MKNKGYFESPAAVIPICALFSTIFQPEVKGAFQGGDYYGALKTALLYAFFAFLLFAIGYAAVDTTLARAKWAQNPTGWKRLAVAAYVVVIYAIVAAVVFAIFR